MRRNSEKQIEVQGHRGCRGLLPENSLPAFEKAIDLGVHTLELDIAITKDNEVIVSHEPFMSRTICFNPDGTEIPEAMDMKHNLYHMTHEEIKEFDCGSKFHPSYPDQEKLKTHKPLLSEVFNLIKKKNPSIRLNIEIKSKIAYYGVYTPYPKDYVEIVLNEINEYRMFNNVNLQSFDLAILEEIKIQSPKMKVALLVDEDGDIKSKLKALSYNPEIISPYYKLLNRDIISAYQTKGFLIIPWTINQKEDLKQMIDWSVDGIITDYPNLLIEMLSK
ncbi:glycerophosphodiester phosphodiesterase family protein [Winogradskyella flava]|uniref:glycerophosphodiester phosphodiesterase family protein n=1 Tax=Winogradskyella flava TaxID=1884876 RepID=UPI00248FD46D|nr:glycerophosphodiester phosphodiesterase family protein [Winogradskyella flava]